MNSEEIIFMVFVGIVVIAIPFMLWYIEREKQREERENREEWMRKNKEKMKGL